MHILSLKIPPLVVMLVMAVLMCVTALATPSFVLLVPGREVIALILAIAGAVTSISGVVSFRRAGRP
jgi:hypothetical protein